MILEEVGSHVRCECDFCGNEVLKYKCQLTNFELQFCNSRCSSDAKKKGEKVDVQTRKRSIEKNGVEHHLMLSETKRKREETNVKKYGVSNQFQRPEIIQAIDDAFNLRTETRQSEIDEKFRATMITRYGADHPSRVPSIYDRMMKSSVSNHEQGHIKTKTSLLWFRSSYERRFLQWCNKHDLEVEGNILIHYEWQNKPKVYWADFEITLSCGTFVCEIKPESLKNTPQNIAKQEAAKIWTSHHDAKFIIIDENALDELESNFELEPFLRVQ